MKEIVAISIEHSPAPFKLDGEIYKWMQQFDVETVEEAFTEKSMRTLYSQTPGLYEIEFKQTVLGNEVYLELIDFKLIEFPQPEEKLASMPQMGIKEN